MKIIIISDTHIDHWLGAFENKFPTLPPEEEYDMVVHLGDSDKFTRMFNWLRDIVPTNKDIIYIPGNHDYYGTSFVEQDFSMKIQAKQYGINLLNPGHIIIDGICFVGAPMWSDVTRTDEICKGWKYFINDINWIRFDSDNLLHPEDMQDLYQTHIEYFNYVLETVNADKFVALTHFVPIRDCIHPKYKSTSNLNGYFCSDVNRDIDTDRFDYWLFGHTHDRFDKKIGKCHFINNAFGYPHENISYQHKIISI